LNKILLAAFAVVALLFGAVSETAEATEPKSDGVNEASLEVDQGSCPDFTLVVTVTGDEDAKTDVRVEGDAVDQLDPGETGVYNLEGTYELDIVDGGLTVNVHVFEVVDSSDSAPCPPETGTIVINKDTDPETNNVGFNFDFDPGSDIVGLEDDDEPIVRSGLTPGEYRIIEDERAGWVLTDIDCDGDVLSDVDITLALRQVVIDLVAGETVTCEFNNVPVAPTATAVPSTPAPTQTPVIVQAPPVVIFVPAPTATKTPVVQSIVPPKTGDAGLVN
jgi:hypothetical protein